MPLVIIVNVSFFIVILLTSRVFLLLLLILISEDMLLFFFLMGRFISFRCIFFRLIYFVLLQRLIDWVYILNLSFWLFIRLLNLLFGLILRRRFIILVVDLLNDWHLDFTGGFMSDWISLNLLLDINSVLGWLILLKINIWLLLLDIFVCWSFEIILGFRMTKYLWWSFTICIIFTTGNLLRILHTGTFVKFFLGSMLALLKAWLWLVVLRQLGFLRFLNLCFLLAHTCKSVII